MENLEIQALNIWLVLEEVDDIYTLHVFAINLNNAFGDYIDEVLSNDINVTFHVRTFHNFSLR